MNEEQQKHIRQLEDLLTAGLLPQAVYDAAIAALSAQQFSGSGAMAQGEGAQAQGAGSARNEGDNYGTINTGLLIQLGLQPGAGEGALRRAYLARLLQEADQLSLGSGDRAGTELKLSSVYTALLTQSADETELARKAESGREIRHRSALDALNTHDRLVLLGGPGSGKTTFVQFVALCLAGEALNSPVVNLQILTAPIPAEPDAHDEEPKAQFWNHDALLPVRIVLRDFAAELPPKRVEVNADTLWQHIEGRLKAASLGNFAPYLQKELLERGGMILLDGLDEVPDPETRREQILTVVQDFSASFSRCRFLATSRTYAYTRQDWKLPGFQEAALLPFSKGQIQRFITAWYGHMAGLQRLSDTEAQGRAEVLKTAVARNERLAELARYPLLLTLIARLHTERGGDLPEKREELYSEAVELLLTEWESLKLQHQKDGTTLQSPSLSEFLHTGRAQIRTQLDKLAFDAHRNQADLTGTADIREDQLIKALLDAAPGNPDLKPVLLKAYLCERSGLIVSHGVELYQFPHRTFQEYLAACHLTVDYYPDQLADLVRADTSRWREAALLAAAKAARGTPASVWMLVDALVFADCGYDPSEDQRWAALLAGQILRETGLAELDPATLSPSNLNKRIWVRNWMRAIVENGWLPPVDRAIAGQVLSVLGDDRNFDELIELPPGDFWMGSDDNYADERPRHRVTLPAFRIGRYPVTNRQYVRFVQATGHDWSSSERDRPDRRNHPARWVNWFDAVAYCDWLTDTGRKEGIISSAERFALPSEAEWERAARGREGRVYPWGDTPPDPERANYAETGIGDTSPVGMFPEGRSEAGCLDMAGNVWEWTRSLKLPYPYDAAYSTRENLAADGGRWQVVRGGAWSYADRSVCCTIRSTPRPDDRDDCLGFRVVLVSAPVTPPRTLADSDPSING